MKEIKKELLESIVKERSEDLQLVDKPGTIRNVKQSEKHLQNRKGRIINIAYINITSVQRTRRIY